jgi:hypothetical protein
MSNHSLRPQLVLLGFPTGFGFDSSTPFLLQGWLGMSFPQQEGRMYPAVGVLGNTDPATGGPSVKAYNITR